MKIYQVNAFTSKGRGGNPAGVVLGAENLSAEKMQQIATELGFSETAFILPSEKSDQRIRFFAPSGEVALCGHATIASYFLLRDQNLLGVGEYKMETLAGVQDIWVSNQDIAMTQSKPVFGEKLDADELINCFALSKEELKCDLPVQICSTGLRKIFVPVKSREILNKIRPDYDQISKVSKANQCIGTYVYTLDCVDGGTAHARNFAPVVGILEDSATGTSAAALSCLLYSYNILDSRFEQNFVIEQGYYINQPSKIKVSLRLNEMGIELVKVSGTASIFKEIGGE